MTKLYLAPDVADEDNSVDGLPTPTFHVLNTQRGGGATAIALWPPDGEHVIYAVAYQLFNPRITNRSAIDIFVRKKGTPGWPHTPTHTRYPINKVEDLGLKRVDNELQIYCGTHITGDGTLDENGARDYYTEKDQIPGFFDNWDA